MAAVRAGGDRQELHERIRRHSLDAAHEVKMEGKPNDLLNRLKGDPGFSTVPFDRILDPKSFVGRAPAQVESFVRDTIDPLRKRYRSVLGQSVRLKV
jgi:adenylosuccinate lyase